MPAEERRALTEKSDAAGLMRLAVHLGLIGILGTLIALKVPYWPLLMLPQGILMIFLFTPLHETTHRTPFKSDWLNRGVGWLCGIAVTLPPEWFRLFHMAHHRFTQDPGRDPELAGGGEPRTLAGYLWRLTGILIWISHGKTFLVNAAGRCRDPFVPEASRPGVTRESRIVLAVYALAAAGSLAFESTVLLYGWWVPILLGQPFLRLYLMAEHGRCPFVSDMFENTRTTLTNRLVRFVAWNMPYHAEHHAYPTVPFHKLPALHARMAPHLKVVEPDGYHGFHGRFVRDLSDGKG
ncbi:MAG: fatty acid desaturase [Alphaproteobacteria bacterium]|nr:fatty acid desaturase [Alphaproteobacteria bacterium]